jgi:hypothetical protein
MAPPKNSDGLSFWRLVAFTRRQTGFKPAWPKSVFAFVFCAALAWVISSRKPLLIKSGALSAHSRSYLWNAHATVYSWLYFGAPLFCLLMFRSLVKRAEKSNGFEELALSQVGLARLKLIGAIVSSAGTLAVALGAMLGFGSVLVYRLYNDTLRLSFRYMVFRGSEDIELVAYVEPLALIHCIGAWTLCFAALNWRKFRVPNSREMLIASGALVIYHAILASAHFFWLYRVSAPNRMHMPEVFFSVMWPALLLEVLAAIGALLFLRQRMLRPA